jgi:predicted unusual protein kinase regulating ubiquinone biosynthesis (AarF/ABC1/UbiB family)
MTPSLTELMRALPEEPNASDVPMLPAPLAKAALQPVPVGRWRRLRLLGTLQAQIGAAYLFYWVRGWFKNADENERSLAETHWKTALRLLDSMGYLRGAIMKVGQTLANFPDIAPHAFVETLDRLYFDAPPMHWSLLQEMVLSELGEDVETVFASFDKQAFAAASLGQVHRARLKNGMDVAVKIQYTGIARTVREDFRNFNFFLLPASLNSDWQYTKDQFSDLFARLETETDYTKEAAVQEKVRGLFREEDGIVVPRVHSQFSTSRMLTMDYLPGVHVNEFMARRPSQDERNEFAIKLIRAWFRMLYAARLSYADVHPGNVLFMDDGRLGVIDFGFMVEHTGDEWKLMQMIDRAMTTGRREDRVAALKEWSLISDDPADADRLRLNEAFADWCWLARHRGGEFDFGDEQDFRRGIDLFSEMVRKRYNRARPSTPAIARLNFGFRSMLYRLKAKVDFRPLAEEEVRAAGWKRSDYA